MRWIMFVVCLLFFVFAVSPVFAGGNLTINCSSLSPNYVNTNQSYSMLLLNMTVESGTGDNTVNVSTINITLAGNATTPNITAVEIRNSTGSTLAANTTWNTSLNKTIIRFPNGLFINASANATVVVVFNISLNAASLKTVAANLNVTADVNTTSSADNITITGTNTSTESRIQSIHATVKISPALVDTSVINQTLTYNFTSLGNDEINNTIIYVPSEYSIVNVTAIEWIYLTAKNVYPTGSPNLATISISGSIINITFASGAYSTYNTPHTILVNISVNTNASATNSTAFNSTLNGANLTNINTTLATSAITNVTTKQLFNIQNVAIIKSTAIVNDTDYWEFNFTLNFTTNVSTGGLLQFRMANWNNTAGNSLNLTNQTALTNTTRYYASMRLSTNSSNTFSVTNDYNFTQGVSLTPAQGAAVSNLYYVILRMIIPSGTQISSTWWTTYNTLFRSNP